MNKQNTISDSARAAMSQNNNDELYVRTINSNNMKTESRHFVLIHGWGMSSSIWQALQAQLLDTKLESVSVTLVDLPGFGQSCHCYSNYEIKSLADQLMALLPARAIYIGWSLGGNIATYLARYFPSRVEALITLASNPCFVVQNDWPQAMDSEVYGKFVEQYNAKPQLTLKRFVALQANDKSLLKQLRGCMVQDPEPDQASAANALQLLESLDVRVLLAELKLPILTLLATDDVLVPIALEHTLQQYYPHVVVKRLLSAGHVFLLSHAQELAALILAFSVQLKQNPAKSGVTHLRTLDQNMFGQSVSFAIDKKQLAKSFSRAAGSYDGAAQLQRQVGNQLLSYLPKNLSDCFSQDRTEKTMVDLGCGTGYFSNLLSQRYPCAELLGIDIASGMLQFARDRLSDELAGVDPETKSVVSWLAGDAENLPLTKASCDLLFSNLTIQWCDISLVLKELDRFLKPGACAVISTLGPKTLGEIRDAWQRVDNYVHVNHFDDMTCIKDTVQSQRGLQLLTLESHSIVLEYECLNDITRELKAIGAHNLNRGRPRGLTGKSRLLAFKQAYEQQRNKNAKLPATYEVIYLVLRKK